MTSCVSEPKAEGGGVDEEEGGEEDKTTRFTKALVGEYRGVKGILRSKTRRGRLFRPYPHQRKCVKRAVCPDMNRVLICHDAGLGKTMTFLLVVAAMHTLQGGRRRKTVITCPKSCVLQWYESVRDTLHVPESRILVSTTLRDFSREAIEHADIIVTSKDIIGNAFGTCYKWYTQHHLDEARHWRSAYDRIPGTTLHPLFSARFDLACWDEVHYDRNPKTRWTKGHELIAQNTSKVVGMTGTPVLHRPWDLCGIATGMDLEPTFKLQKSWVGKSDKVLNKETVQRFRGLLDRASDKLLDLPPLTQHYHDFDVAIDPAFVDDYNETLLAARSLRFYMERRGTATASDLNKLMSYLQTLQQFLVSPLLAKMGAAAMRGEPELYERASLQDTGVLRALKSMLVDLTERGFHRVLVAACHVSLLRVARLYIERESPSVGSVMIYDGSLSSKQREETVHRFLANQHTVLLMSIEAGGTGLHLVPGANAVVFFGSRPYSPQSVLQTMKRVHRIGQEDPVEVHHLVAKGSVDAAITLVHKDKSALATAVADNDWEALNAENGRWKSTGRIVDNCKYLTCDGQMSDTETTDAEVARAISERRSRRGAPDEDGARSESPETDELEEAELADDDLLT